MPCDIAADAAAAVAAARGKAVSPPPSGAFKYIKKVASLVETWRVSVDLGDYRK